VLKIVYVFHRHPKLSLDECHRFWRETHGPLVRRHAATIALIGYTQVYRIDDPLNDSLRASRGSTELYDGVAELCWKDQQALFGAFASPEAQVSDQELFDDERRFIDIPSSPLWLAEDHVVIEGGPRQIVAKRESPIIELVYFFRRLSKLSMQECQRYWRETHGPLVQQHAAALHVLRYVQVHTLDDPLNEALRAPRTVIEPYDGVAKLWWKDREDLARALATPEGQRAAEEVLEDERRFIDFSRSSLWLAKEHVVL
jgi:uncharacterized protein (TIGR02118 family)